MEINISGLSEMRKFAGNVAKSLRGGETLALIGELGAGKTTFTKMLLRKLGIRAKTASPTFVLMLPYKLPGKKLGGRRSEYTVIHMDLYRLKGYGDVRALGVSELWSKPKNIFIIEWADKIRPDLPKKSIFLTFKFNGVKKSRARKMIVKNAPKYFKI